MRSASRRWWRWPSGFRRLSELGAAPILLVLLAGWARPGAAAEEYFAPTPAWTGPAEATISVALGDVDGDGDLDLVRGNDVGGTTLYLNMGGTFASTPAWTSPVEATNSVALGDLDGDGDLDLVCGNYVGGSTLYLNTGGTFAAAPAWTSPEEATISVALGDVDGDGDLDLVCGNYVGGTTLYLNTGGTFAAAPAWTGPAEVTLSVALGDADGDGDLDLVRGNYGGGSTLYLNDGASFASAPAWRGVVEATTSVALGDVDGDGDLDLVCGNYAGGSTLYRNTGGTFAAAPVWTGPAEPTRGVALGDVDGDGDLDLVCGNRVNAQVSTLYLNTGGTFAAAPAWTGPAEATWSVALGDVDGDGDLDLVRGNYGEGATLYLGISGTFAATPAWTGPVEATRSAALGDVDGDGVLDLVRGNDAGGTTLTLGTGSTFAAAPAWTGPAESTWGVALGDVDGDGDLDLVRGNYGGGATLYLNVGGTFAAAPAWTGLAEATWSVALGDVDGDGDLDLVCGNDTGGTTLYLNIGGTFAAPPAWTGPAEATRSVALGDVDGDGDLDLVRGNYDGGATLYLNTGGTFAAAPAWTGPTEGTSSVALGDVDGDGDLDLVRGNELSGGSTLYLNIGGTFAAAPAWTGPTERTVKVALGDVDGDGDLDLVRGNLGEGPTLYLNTGGTFAAAPAWTGPVDATWSLALGDVDEDGALDLFCASDNQGAMLFRRKSPWLSGSGAPARSLPNNPAYLRSVRMVASAPNLYRISVAAFDAEADPVWIVGEYQLEGSSAWRPMALAGSPLRCGPFATSATGVAQSVDWDVTSLPFDRRKVVARLRAVSRPRQAGVIQFEPSYVTTVGRIIPARPALSSAPGRIDFGTLTVGDSSMVALRLSNPGNLDLVIERIDSPGPETQVTGVAGLVIPPGQTRPLDVVFAPRAPPASLGPLVVHSNDPLTPAVDVALAADVRALECHAQLVAVSPELPLGEAATVIVTPAPQVHVEAGFVLYRARGSSAFSDSSALVAQGASFAALIPGRGVTEAGLEYYVRVENSGVFATDPPGAPGAVYSQPVAAPSGLASVAQADASGDFPVGRATPVVLSLPAGSSFERGAVHYRPAGAADYDSVGLAIVEVAPGVFAPSATIPAEAVGPRGVEYWSSVATRTRALSDPPVDPASQPRLVRTNVSSLREGATHAGGHYRMVTVPLDLSLPSSSSLEDLIGGQGEFGPYDPTRWRSFRWLPASSAYLEISAANVATGALRPEPGRAFWLIARDANSIDTAPVAGRSTVFAPITLEPGWNQVGSPYAYPVAWSGVSAASASGPVTLEPPVEWDEAASRYGDTEVTVLEPFQGCWIRNPTTAPVQLSIPPVEFVAGPAAATSAARADSQGWSVQITAECGAASDSRNFAGVSPLAREGGDALDRSESPMAPGDALSLYFLGDEPGARASSDLRPPPGGAAGDPAWQGRRWTFDVARRSADAQPAEADLVFAGLEGVPAEVELRLVDRTLGRGIDLRRGSTYRYVTGVRGYVATAAEARFELRAGTRAFVEATGSGRLELPVRTQLLPHYPNPVTGTCLVRFDVARAGRVSLEVYDFAGRRVRTLADDQREAGRFELVWRGDDGAGRRLPPGVYLLRLAGPDRADVRRVVLIQ